MNLSPIDVAAFLAYFAVVGIVVAWTVVGVGGGGVDEVGGVEFVEEGPELVDLGVDRPWAAATKELPAVDRVRLGERVSHESDGRFVRVDDGFTDGTGVGLTIARSICRAHGGSLTASSTGIGEGVAIPHGKMAGLDRLLKGIRFPRLLRCLINLLQLLGIFSKCINSFLV